MTGILWRHHLNSKKQFSFQYCKTKKIKKSCLYLQEKNNATLIKAQEIENEINKIFIRNYNLDEYSEIVKDRDDITLYINLKHLYGSDISDNIRQNRYFSDQLSEMMSYSIGCMMGRYSSIAKALSTPMKATKVSPNSSPKVPTKPSQLTATASCR